MLAFCNYQTSHPVTRASTPKGAAPQTMLKRQLHDSQLPFDGE
jgi:hypothetical protein